MKLIEGQRYEWCIGRVKNGKKLYQNGLFTGKYTEGNFALFQTKTGDMWEINPNHVVKYLKGRK